MPLRLLRATALIALLAVLSVSCRVATEDVALSGLPSGLAPQVATNGDLAGLPVLGPIPASSHWHAAYVVRICDDVLAPFESPDDPLGIHSHGDGLMHVHPFFVESGYEAATVGLFADAMGMDLRDGELTLPNGGTWRDGDLCDGVPSRVFVDKWRDPDPASSVERIFSGIDEIRYLADGELYQIAFAPADSLPVVPPSTAGLGEYSNLVTPGEPWVDVDATATIDQASFWPVKSVGTEPCAGESVPERVLFGQVRCFEPAGSQIAASAAVASARVVVFNRQPAVEIRMKRPLAEVLFEHFGSTEDPLALALEIDGVVVTAPLLQRPPVSDRLVVSGGMSAEAATSLATILND